MKRPRYAMYEYLEQADSIHSSNPFLDDWKIARES